jgi:hypothetical protein
MTVTIVIIIGTTFDASEWAEIAARDISSV